MKSCIFEGTIRHRRSAPVKNEFRYRLFRMYLDLSELEPVFSMHPLWSHDRPNLAWFRRQDHFGNPQVPLDRAVRDLVQGRTGNRPGGPIPETPPGRKAIPMTKHIIPASADALAAMELS